MAEWTVKSVDGKPVEAKEEHKVEQTVEETTEATPEVKVNEVTEDGTIKVKLDGDIGEKTETPTEETTEEVVEEIKEESSEEPVKEEDEQIIEIVDEEPKQEKQLPEVEAPAEPQAVEEPKQSYPEDIQKLVEFMEETGGSLADYANLNKNYDDLKPVDLMREYYKQTKPHLADNEIDFLMDDKFGYNDDAEDREKRSKEILWKEEVYNAKNYLNKSKDRYYADLKLSKQSELAPEQQEAISYYAEHKEVQKKNEQLKSTFLSETDKVFNDLKGFDFKVGDKKYRYKVNDIESTKKYQSDLNNFVGEFLGEDGSINNATGYHKALFAAKNADKIAQHFYEQGRSDALKSHTAKSKNIDMAARSDAGSVTTSDGTKVKVVSGSSSNNLKINLKNY